MEQLLSELIFKTTGEGFTNITPCINRWIIENHFEKGILIITTKHTSCSLTINENADPKVLNDLSNYMKALVPEEGFKDLSGLGNLKNYKHKDEGSDDMPAHIKTSLTCSSISLSVDKNALILGIWQAIYLWEHRHLSHSRTISIHGIGEIG